MEFKTALSVFAVIFIAELGDKTQLATLLFSADKSASKFTVFASASLALVLSVAIAVVAGALVSEYIGEKTLRLLAGAGFVAIGVWTLVTA